jgi:hypothetical protein
MARASMPTVRGIRLVSPTRISTAMSGRCIDIHPTRTRTTVRTIPSPDEPRTAATTRG